MKNLDYYVAIGYKVINKIFGRDSLSHHGILGQKHGVRNGPPYPLSENQKSSSEKQHEKKSDNNKENKEPPSKKKKKYEYGDKGPRIYDPYSDDYYYLADGERITHKETFAGKGGKDPLDDEVKYGLAEQEGGDPENWMHRKGKGVVDYWGENRKAEIHWFEEETVGEIKHRVKKWLE